MQNITHTTSTPIEILQAFENARRATIVHFQKNVGDRVSQFQISGKYHVKWIINDLCGVVLARFWLALDDDPHLCPVLRDNRLSATDRLNLEQLFVITSAAVLQQYSKETHPLIKDALDEFLKRFWKALGKLVKVSRIDDKADDHA